MAMDNLTRTRAGQAGRSAVDRTYVVLTCILLAVAAFIWIELFQIVDAHRYGFAVDFNAYRDHTARWLSGGQFYLAHQLAGPTIVQDGDPLYPPLALYLLVPFQVLPPILWWAIPISVIVGAIAWLRPRRWTWPLLALILVWPRTSALIYYGNPGMWADAAIAAGVVAGWPSALVLFKPSLAFFAPIGIRHRGWWITLGILVIASLPFGALWIDYARVLQNSSVPLTYSFLDLPLALAPVVAWLGRRDPSRGIAPPWRPGRISGARGLRRAPDEPPEPDGASAVEPDE
jgi:hypothetical protein